MKILFSPSEAKSDFVDSGKLSCKNILFPSLFTKRVEVIEKLNSFIENNSSDNLIKFFGIKNSKECENLAKLDIFNSPTCKAIQRYSGVAYQYLDFKTLEISQQNWLCKNTIIFSNLFGPLSANDKIPFYRFKQGATLNGFKTELFYRENFSSEIDNYIGSDLVVDLRAGFYEKFYSLNCKHITMKFIKNGKVVSHWAKAYRGRVLRELSKFQPDNIGDFESINFAGLSIEEIIEKKLKKEYIFKIDS